MTDRVVKVSVVANVNSYLAGMDKVAQKTREGRDDVKKLGAQLEAQRKTFNALGGAMIAVGGLTAAGLAIATAKAAEFDKAMSAVAAATHAGAGEMRSLRDAALQVSQGTKFSATEAAHAIEELSKAGLKTKDIINGGLKGALDLAAAGEMDVATAAGVASTTLGQFGLDGGKAAHVADVLAAGAGKAMGDVSDLAQALGQSGTVAAQFGISLDDAVGSLAAFASKGLLGSDAGTSFRTMLLRLANPTGEAASTMKNLGIEAYDAGGKFVGMAALAGQLKKSLGGLTQEQRNAALAVIFGQDAIRAANVLYVEGAKGIKDWTAKVNDTGYAADTASRRLDNLKGDLTKLQTAFDNALIGIGESSQGPLRDIAQSLTGLLNGFNKLPEPAKNAAFWVGAVGSAVAIAGGIALLGVPKVAAFKIALIELGVSADKVSTGVTAAGRALSGLGRAAGVAGAITTAVVGVDALADAISKNLLPSASEIDNKMRQAKTGVQLFSAALAKEGIHNTQTATDLLKNLGTELDAVAKSDFWNPNSISGTTLTLGSKLADIANSGDMAAFSAQFRTLAKDAHLTDRELRTFIGSNSDLKDALTQQATAAGMTASKANLLKIAMGDTAQATSSVASSADDAADSFQAEQDRVNGVRDAYLNLMKQINDSNDVNQKAVSANAAWRSGLAALTEQVKKNGKTLDESTAKGAENADMLASLAGKAQDAAAAQFEVDKKTMSAEDATKKYSSTLAAQKTSFEKAAIAAGFNADQVKKLADRVFGLPSKAEIKILIDKSQAEAQLANLTKARTMFIKVRYDKSTDSIRLGRASGGILPGAPSSRDNMVINAASGEYVVNAAQTSRNLAALEYINSGGVIPGYANGGFVRPQYAQPSFAFPVAGGSRTVTVNQDIHPTTGMSEADVGRLAAEKTAFVLRLGE